VALTLGGLVGYQLIVVTPSSASLSALPLVLIPTAAVPLLLALHITSVFALLRAPLPALATGSRLDASGEPLPLEPEPGSTLRH
jgi:hypothetical protein